MSEGIDPKTGTFGFLNPVRHLLQSSPAAAGRRRVPRSRASCPPSVPVRETRIPLIRRLGKVQSKGYHRFLSHIRKDKSTNTKERAVSTADNATEKIELLLSQKKQHHHNSVASLG